MQDIVPRKSIREITKSQVQGSVTSQNSYHKDVEENKTIRETQHQFDEYPHIKNELNPKERRPGRILFVFVLVILISLGAFFHFQKSATVYITTNTETLTSKDTELDIPVSEIKTLFVTASTTISIKTSTGTPILTKAKGTVTIYNANSVEQLLVAGTRLETPNGKIYRLDARITVPKMKNVTTPGSIQALVTADNHGAEYNITQSDFTFPGLIGSPRYKTVYARTKNGFIGGSETSQKIIDEKDKDQKIETFVKEKSISLETELDLKKNASTIILREPFTTTVFEKLSDTQGLVTVTTSLYVLDMQKFATILAKNQKQNIETKMEFVENPTNMVIKYESIDKEEIHVQVNGSVLVRPFIDIENIKNILAGTSMKQFRENIKDIAGVQEILFTSKPFWVSTFPQASRIFIEQK